MNWTALAGYLMVSAAGVVAGYFIVRLAGTLVASGKSAARAHGGSWPPGTVSGTTLSPGALLTCDSVQVGAKGCPHRPINSLRNTWQVHSLA
jgi:hypothetical protein